MRQFFKFMFASMLGVFLAFILIFFIFLIFISAIVASTKSNVSVIGSNSVLELNFDRPIKERTSKNPFHDFSFSSLKAEQEPGLNDILKDIEAAKTDNHIKGILLNLSVIPAGISTIEEIRNALLDFKSSGKFILAYSEYYSQGSYYLASVANQIYLNPQGGLIFHGLHSELTFFKGALEKLDIEPEVIRHGKFKSAVEPFINDKMSPENRAQMSTLLHSIWNSCIERIAESRNVDKADLQKIANNLSVRKPEDALELKLVDKLCYYDQLESDLKKITGIGEKEKVRLVELRKYDRSASYSRPFSYKKIAVVYAVGSISGGDGDDETIGSGRISEAIRKARTDSSIKAIVLRVNSPGGSALASDVIWREVALARKVKPVVVSMGDVAASGGYYISCAADKIVAEPNTITGSIGVFGLLFNAQKMFNSKLGITFDTVKTGMYADLGSATRPMSAAEKEIIQDQVERIYDTFLSHVAEGRAMEKSSVDSIGQGRVWSGLDAKRLGLVDAIGGLNTAVEMAAKLAKLDNYRTTDLPEQKEFLEQLLEDFSAKTSIDIMEKQLGTSYKYYRQMESLVKMNGIQARLPFDIEVY